MKSTLTVLILSWFVFNSFSAFSGTIVVNEVNVRVNYAPPLTPPEKMDRYFFNVPETGLYRAELHLQASDPGAYERLNLEVLWGLSTFDASLTGANPRQLLPWVGERLSRAPVLRQEFEAPRGRRIMLAYHTSVVHRELGILPIGPFPSPTVLATLRIARLDGGEAERKTSVEHKPIERQDRDIMERISRYNRSVNITWPAPDVQRQFMTRCLDTWTSPSIKTIAFGIMGRSSRHSVPSDRGIKFVMAIYNKSTPQNVNYFVYFESDRDGLTYRAFGTRGQLLEEIERLIREVE